MGGGENRRLAVFVRRPDGPADWAAPLEAALAESVELVPGRDGGRPPAELVVDLSEAPAVATARLGTWLLTDADGHVGARLGVAAFARGDPAVEVRVVALRDAAAATLLESGWLPLLPLAWPAAHRRLMAAAAALLGLAVRRASADGPATVLPAAAPAPAPLALALATARRLGRQLLAELQEDEWAVGLIEAPAAEVAMRFEPGRVRWLPRPRGGFLADPMALPSPAGAPPLVLAEAFGFRERLGHIVAIDGGAPSTVLRRPFHLSYPQLMEAEGAIWCLPEMGAAGRVQLFRADRFPDRWVEDAVLLDGFPAVDATLWRGLDCWWLFTGRLDRQRGAELHLFHAAKLRGAWSPHPLNPVRVDVRGGRMAGPIIDAGGRLLRPGQDCAATYGAAVVVHEITELSATGYRERVVGRLEPDPAGPYPHGLHTLCDAGAWTLIDGKRHRPSWRPLLATLRGLALRRRG